MRNKIVIPKQRSVELKFILGLLLGIVIATVGFNVLAKLLDSGANKIKSVVEEQA